MVVLCSGKDNYGDYNGRCGLLGGYEAMIWPLKGLQTLRQMRNFFLLVLGCFAAAVELGNLHESKGAKVSVVCTRCVKSPLIYRYISRDYSILFKII